MLTFKYTAIDPKTNKQIKSHVEADSEKSAASVISEQGLMPIDIELATSGGGLFKGRVPAKDKVIFYRQLSTLVSAGLPITQSLRTVTEQVDNKNLVSALTKIGGQVEGGMSLAEAMEQHPDIFDKVVTSLIASGETSGTLDETLQRIAMQTEKNAEMASKIRGAMVYPAIVLVVIVLVVVFMLTTVLPQIEVLYDDLGQELPFVTVVLLAISSFISSYWWAAIIALAGVGYGIKKYTETEKGRRQMDVLKMSVPLFGKMFKKLYMARFSRTGSTLLQSGVQMLEMMRITSDAVGNVLIKEDILKASRRVQGGKALSESLEESLYFLPLVPQMINIGEKSGSIDGMMSKAADYYEKELDDEIKTISTTIEPVLMVVLALVAGTMVGAILIPVYDLVGENIAI